MTAGFGCDPGRLRAAAWALDGAGDRIDAVRGRGTAVDPALWGPLGRACGAADRYRLLVDAVEDHLAAAARFCGDGAAALIQVAAGYQAAEDEAARSAPALAGSAGGLR